MDLNKYNLFTKLFNIAVGISRKPRKYEKTIKPVIYDVENVKEIDGYSLLYTLISSRMSYEHIKIVNRVKYSSYGVLLKYEKNHLSIKIYKNQKETSNKNIFKEILNRLIESKEEVYFGIAYDNNLYDYDYLICLEENEYEKEYNKKRLDELKNN